MKRDTLVSYLNDYLRIGDVKDYGPQGLQVETDKTEVNKIALAVDVSPEILQEAAMWGADMLLVHHGIFWGKQACIAGALGERVRLMMKHGINLYAAHLALDAHPVVGNNAVLGEMFGLENVEWWFAPMGTPLAVVGDIRPTKIKALVQQTDRALNTESILLNHGEEIVLRLAILSGAGADQVLAAKEMGADTYLTGETSHAHYWQAADYGMNVIFAGHYATETVGVQALGAHIAHKFQLETKFFDFPTKM